MKKLLLIVVLFVLTGCGKKEIVQNEVILDGQQKLAELEINKFYAWVDYMPGSKANGLLRLSGDFILKSSVNYDFTKLVLGKINIIQDTTLFYIVKPLLKENPTYTKKNKKNLLLSLMEGLVIEEEFDINKLIDIELIFQQSDQQYRYYIKNIKIEKTY